MRKQLLVQLDAAPSMEHGMTGHWLLREPGRPAGDVGHGPLREASGMAAGAQVVVMAPARDVVFTRAAVPAMNRQRLAKAVPFALEDQLADDIDALHVALGQRDAPNDINCAVVSRQQLEEWQRAVRELGLHPHVMVSELQGLPLEEDSWSLLLTGSEALLRTGPQSGVAFDSDNWQIMLAGCLAQVQDAPPKTLRCFVAGDEDQHLTGLLADWCGAHQIEWVRAGRAPSGFELLSRGFDEAQAINLLQGDFSRRQQIGRLIRPWLPAAVLLSAWIVLQLVANIADAIALSKEQKALQQQIEQVFREAVPEARRVVNPRQQMETRLAELRGSGSGESAGFVAMLAKAAPILKGVDSLVIRSLRYKTAQLDIDVEISDLQALDGLKQRLVDQSGFQVDIVSASQREAKVEGRIELKVKGGTP